MHLVIETEEAHPAMMLRPVVWSQGPIKMHSLKALGPQWQRRANRKNTGGNSCSMPSFMMSTVLMESKKAVMPQRIAAVSKLERTPTSSLRARRIAARRHELFLTAWSQCPWNLSSQLPMIPLYSLMTKRCNMAVSPIGRSPPPCFPRKPIKVRRICNGHLPSRMARHDER